LSHRAEAPRHHSDWDVQLVVVEVEVIASSAGTNSVIMQAAATEVVIVLVPAIPAPGVAGIMTEVVIVLVSTIPAPCVAGIMIAGPEQAREDTPTGLLALSTTLASEEFQEFVKHDPHLQQSSVPCSTRVDVQGLTASEVLDNDRGEKNSHPY